MSREPIERELSTADLAAAADRSVRDPRLEQERSIQERQVDHARAEGGPADVTTQAQSAPLLAQEVVEEFHVRWNEIQAGFVDEPRRAVERADGLVADAIKRLAESFARERSQLETQWDRGDDVNTEDLRQSLQRYRSFFSRLLSV